MRLKSLKTITSSLALVGLALVQPSTARAGGGHGVPHLPTIRSTEVVKEVDPFNPDSTERLYGTLDMMDLVKAKGKKIVVIAHEIFPSGTQGNPGNIPGFPLTSPDTYDGVNRGLGLGAITAWNLKTGEFSFLIPPKDTAASEPYDIEPDWPLGASGRLRVRPRE